MLCARRWRPRRPARAGDVLLVDGRVATVGGCATVAECPVPGGGCLVATARNPTLLADLGGATLNGGNDLGGELVSTLEVCSPGGVIRIHADIPVEVEDALLLLDLMDLVAVGEQCGEGQIQLDEQWVPPASAADPASPTVRDACEHSGQRVGVLAGVLGLMRRVEDVLIVEAASGLT